jgi:Fe-S cluster assembly protein SufD
MSMEATKHYITEFGQFEKNGASKSPSWVHDIRKGALTAFADKGFPTTGLEEWKYTNIAPIADSAFKYSSSSETVPAERINEFLVPGADHYVMAFVNGHFSKEHSNLAGVPTSVIAMNLRDAWTNNEEKIKNYLGRYAAIKDKPFTALNTAFLNDGACIIIPEKVVVRKPIHLLFLSAKKNEQIASHIRNLIVVGEEAAATILLSYHSLENDQNLTNAVTEVVAHKNSSVELVKIQKESPSSYHVENVHAHQHQTSTVHLFSLALGGAIARNDMSVIIDGERAECNLNGLYITSGDQLIDHHTFMHHIHPNCPSHELFKGILTDDSRAVFNGKVYVDPEAQKTDSKQTNRNLLLSDTAIVDTKPELEIFADDVKCTHGAAVGGLNESYKFYLKSRGISDQATRTMLTVGFAAEVTGKIRDEAIRRHVDVLVVDHLKAILHNADVPEIIHGDAVALQS